MNGKIENILYKLALKAYKKGEVPVAAVIVWRGKIIAKSYNKKNKTRNLMNHAEINCIIKASKKLKDWRLSECDLYVTLKPCHMCAEIIKESRIENVYYLSDNLKSINYKTNFIQVDNTNNNFSELLTSFFKKMR